MKLINYRLNNFIKEKILIAINKGNINFGVSCLFINLNKNVGIKLYPLKQDRDYSLIKQKELFEKGLTPAVGKSFMFKYNLPKKDNDNDLYFKEYKLYGFFTQKANTKFNYKYKACEKLYHKAKKKGVYWGDDHIGNIGKIGKKLVIIDTDPVSFKGR